MISLSFLSPNFVSRMSLLMIILVVAMWAFETTRSKITSVSTKQPYKYTAVPFTEVSGREHEVLHIVVVPLNAPCRAMRGIRGWSAIHGCSTQVVVHWMPIVSILYSARKVKSQQFVVAEATTFQRFATPFSAKIIHAERCCAWAKPSVRITRALYSAFLVV